MQEFSQIAAFAVVILILYIGDIFSIKTKAKISSVFVCALLFVIGFWTILPPNIIEIAGFTAPVVSLSVYLLIVNMGTLLSFQQLISQWKTVSLALCGILLVTFGLYFVGRIFVDDNTVFVAIPTLIGGVVASAIMNQAALKLGLESLAVFAVIIYVIQGFAGYPLTSFMLHKEGSRLLNLHRTNSLKAVETIKQDSQEELFKKLPLQYQTNYFILLKVAIIAYLAYITSVFFDSALGFKVNALILCLVFGVIARSFGFLEREPLLKANSFGFILLIIMLFVFNSLNKATPDMLFGLVYALFVTISLAVIFMFLFSLIVAKVSDFSQEMAFSILLTALYGFPADYVITKEVINSLTKNEEERKVLTENMMPQMLVGGFVSVTIVSVVLAGIFADLLYV